jgi:ATP-binding cassette, subfamily C (CFTR/MRP), member 1
VSAVPTRPGSKENKFALLFAAFEAYMVDFLAGVIPRLLFTGFRFAQPFLINRVVDFVGEPWTDSSSDVIGGLVGATIIVYVGIAVRAFHPIDVYMLSK